MTNVFYQPETLTEMVFILPDAHATLLEMGFEDITFAQSRFFHNEEAGIWRLRLLLDKSQLPEASARLAILREAHGIDFPDPQTALVQPRDWVADVQASFKPIRAGRFYVHGSHIADVPKVGLVPILMDAGAAFGTGEHETTASCLAALDDLAKTHRFCAPLDMGCGSGILAIAVAHLWGKPVMAVDNDAMSVKVARENMRLNRVTNLVNCRRGDGYLQLRGRYDLIIANILARPLMEMAHDLRAHLEPGGTVVLSGLLARQERMVLFAHRMQRLRLVRRYVKNGWAALILQ